MVYIPHLPATVIQAWIIDALRCEPNAIEKIVHHFGSLERAEAYLENFKLPNVARMDIAC